ncbi:MAG: F0F1 ATP synthase subunit delta [Propionibacteriaceae bacterium]|jgi:F-type H+-transporting ATPase subunit delta|nr:F0F1 ATP synthase subunit delta [Propionibacteriaceae bacterium]
MSARLATRSQALDRVTDSYPPAIALAQEIFGIAALLAAKPALRRALADSAAPEAARRRLAENLFASRVGSQAAAIVAQACAEQWDKPIDLVGSLESEGVRVAVRVAQAAGNLPVVEAELFSLKQTVAGDDGLRLALSDLSAAVQRRRQLVRDLVADKVNEVTLVLAEHAVYGHNGSYEVRLEEGLRLAAEIQEREIAEVVAAAPLTPAEEQRLAAVLRAKVGRDISLQITIDPKLIGGIKIRIGDELIDGTVLGRLQAAREALK